MSVQRRRRGGVSGISLEYDSDGTNDSDLEEYDEENDSVGSLEEFIVSDDGEESDYENDDEELCEDTDSMSSGDELENGDNLEMPPRVPRRSRRLQGRPRFVVVLSDDESDSESDTESELGASAAEEETNY